MARKTAPASVYVIVDTPDHTRSIAAGQPPTQLAAYRLDIPNGQAVDDVVGAFIASGQFGALALFGVVDESDVTALQLKPTLEPCDVKPGATLDSGGQS